MGSGQCRPHGLPAEPRRSAASPGEGRIVKVYYPTALRTEYPVEPRPGRIGRDGFSNAFQRALGSGNQFLPSVQSHDMRRTRGYQGIAGKGLDPNTRSQFVILSNGQRFRWYHARRVKPWTRDAPRCVVASQNHLTQREPGELGGSRRQSRGWRLGEGILDPTEEANKDESPTSFQRERGG